MSFKSNVSCPRCREYLEWCVPTVIWLGHYECPSCWLCFYYMHERLPGRRKLYRRVLVQGRQLRAGSVAA